jgi:hypothetical protein
MRNSIDELEWKTENMLHKKKCKPKRERANEGEKSIKAGEFSLDNPHPGSKILVEIH